MLSSELAQTKKQCDELITFLRQCVKVGPDTINRIMNVGSEASVGGSSNCDDDENDKCMKLFGVIMKKKRGCGESSDLCNKEMKRECSKVCN